MTKPDYSTMTDAELDQHLAVLDGWMPTTKCRTCLRLFAGHQLDLNCDGLGACSPLLLGPNSYTTSLDAAVALAGRLGYRWKRLTDVDVVYVGTPHGWFHCSESETKPTARALAEALAAAKQQEGEE